MLAAGTPPMQPHLQRRLGGAFRGEAFHEKVLISTPQIWGDMGRYGEIAAARLEVEAAHRVEAGHLWGRARTGRRPLRLLEATQATSHGPRDGYLVRAMKYVAPLA